MNQSLQGNLRGKMNPETLGNNLPRNQWWGIAPLLASRTKSGMEKK